MYRLTLQTRASFRWGGTLSRIYRCMGGGGELEYELSVWGQLHLLPATLSHQETI